MLKRGRVLIMAVLWVGVFVRPGFALELTGTVIDTFHDGITVSAAGKVLFNKGDRVDVSYRAGSVEMSIGQYEILQVKENVFVARQIASTMTPFKAMNIWVMSSLAPATNLPGAHHLSTMPPSCGQKRAAAINIPNAPPLPPQEGTMKGAVVGTGDQSGPLPANFSVYAPIKGEPVAPVSAPGCASAKGGCPCGDFKAAKARIISGEDPARRWWLGVALNDVPVAAVPTAARATGIAPRSSTSSSPRGVRVVAVDPGSPADKAGIKRDDLILKLDRIAIKDSNQFIQQLNQSSGRIRVVIDRAGKIIKKKFLLEKLR